MSALCRVIEKAKMGDNQSLEKLITKFEPIINSISWKGKSEYLRTDLTIFLISLIKGIKLEYIENLSDGALVKYIQKSLYREYYKLNKRSLIMEVELNDIFNSTSNEYQDIEYKILLDEFEVKSIISERQKYMLLKKYCYLSTEEEITRELKVSRQAVNKMHHVTIRNIKKYLN